MSPVRGSSPVSGLPPGVNGPMVGVVRAGVRLFAGVLFVHYGQACVESGADHADDFSRAVAGQANGLLGAQVPGCLFLGIGLHTGYVGFTVESHPGPPAVADEWEDVVEACFRPVGPDARLVQWGGQAQPLDLAVRRYRVRYCATGMDQAKDADATVAGVIDSYLLQFWPDSAAREDAVLRQGSAAAAYWHRVAQGDR